MSVDTKIQKPEVVSVEALLVSLATTWKGVAREVHRAVGDVEEAIGKSVDELLDEKAKKGGSVKENLEGLDRALSRMKQAARRPDVVLATTGTTSSGKSTVANVLIGAELMPKAVQEMSAGVVVVEHHPDLRRLVVSETRGATWQTGDWDGLSADEIRGKLESIMKEYRTLLDGDAAAARDDIEPPGFTIYWPTRMGARASEFGLPPHARLKIVDLPGLKYVNDDINGNVVRQMAKNALCLVTYNSFETDSLKQKQLLTDVVDQVKNLGGTPARMLFVINRIDAFLRDENPEKSVQAFMGRISTQIRNGLLAELGDYKKEIESLRIQRFSSEPALYSILAAESEAEKRVDYINRIDKGYNELFPDEVIQDFPRSVAKFSPAQYKIYIGLAREQSYLDEFEQGLADHIRLNLPELIVPDLVTPAWQATSRIMNLLETAVRTQSLNHETEVKAAQGRLDGAFQRLKRLVDENLGLLEPLRSIGDAGDNDVGAAINGASKQVGDTFGCPLDSLGAALEGTTTKPINRLAAHLLKLYKDEGLSNEYIDSLGTKVLLERLSALKQSEYGKIPLAAKEHRLKKAHANYVEKTLALFVNELSVVVNRLVERESKLQEQRVTETLKALYTAIEVKLDQQAALILTGADSEFRSLSGAFSRDVKPLPLRLSGLTFSPKVKAWEREWIEHRDVVETKEGTRKTWKTLWLFEESYQYQETRQVAEQKFEEGKAFDGFGFMIETFFKEGRSGRGIERDLQQWLVSTLERFCAEMEAGLEEGVKEYNSMLLKRLSEIEAGGAAKIQEVERHLSGIAQARAQGELAKEWRNLLD